MPTISTFHTKQRGFTLIEIMVVMVILATMAALIAGGIRSGGDRNAKLEAQRFTAIVNEVRDEALVSGKNIFLQVDESSAFYEFSLQRPQQGNASNALLDRRYAHKSVEVKWEVYEQFIDEDGTDNQKVLITSLGEITPFRIRFVGEERDFVVALNDSGNLFTESKSSGRF